MEHPRRLHLVLNPRRILMWDRKRSRHRYNRCQRLAAVYVRFYPLFQQAYQSLGYPNGYFNDRLVVTIDNLLAAPDITTDIALVRPNVMYQFADPKLEDLSAGQKLMLRMGPNNAAVIKAKLRELRAQVAGGAHDLAPAAGSSSSGAH